MLTNRLSLLDQARYCGQAPILSAEHGVSRWATISQAFHSLCAQGDDAEELMALLDPEEREHLAKLHKPTDVTVGDAVLRYPEAETEVPVGLTEDGECCAYDAEDRLTQGTLDFAWVKQINGHRVAYVADLKLSEWTKSADPSSLQLAGYGMAYADLHEADYYCCGVFHAREGTWHWGELISPLSRTSRAQLKAIQAAVANIGQRPTTGAHCNDCYGRMHCPEHLLPALDGEHPLRELSQGNPSHDAILLALTHAKQLKDAAEKLEETAKAWVRRNGPVEDPVSGKRFMATMCKGRETFDKKALEREHGKEFVRQFTKVGKPYERFMWVK